MNKLIYSILFISNLFFFASCETEADINLKTATPRLVIDAMIKEAEICKVSLTLTQGFWDQDKPKTISNAIITLKDSKGNKEVLIEDGNSGNYTSIAKGIIGETYTLCVEVDGEEYQVTEKIPEVVEIESIRTYKIEVGTEVRYFPCITFNDPKGVENYYLYNVFINGRRLLDPHPDDDEYSDGKFREPVLAFNDEENDDKKLEIGDHILVELQSVSKGAHQFYKTIKSPGGSQNSNPTSNFSGNVLGVFNAYSSSMIEMTVTEEDFY